MLQSRTETDIQTKRLSEEKRRLYSELLSKYPDEMREIDEWEFAENAEQGQN